MGQLHTRKKRRTGERKEEKQSRMLDANSTCQLDFSRSSFEGHLTTALTVKLVEQRTFEEKLSCILFHRVSFQLFNYSLG